MSDQRNVIPFDKTANVKIGTLPAGNYYIGDPCYVIQDRAEWYAFLDALWAAEKTGNGENEAVVFQHRGHTVFVSPTNTGDGCYLDQYGGQYGVDAGMIAAVPVELLNRKVGQHFPDRFDCAVDLGHRRRGGKNIRIGTLVIRT